MLLPDRAVDQSGSGSGIRRDRGGEFSEAERRFRLSGARVRDSAIDF